MRRGNGPSPACAAPWMAGLPADDAPWTLRGSSRRDLSVSIGMTASASSGARYGVTSMVAPLQRVLVRRPALAGDWDDAGWRTPDPVKLERQHEAFVELLDGLGVEIEIAAALDGQVDSVYMHDPLILSGRGGIPLQMAKPARMREPGHSAEELQRLGVPVLGTLEGDAFADGGDRFWLDDKTAAIGLGYRTNRKGAARVQELL